MLLQRAVNAAGVPAPCSGARFSPVFVGWVSLRHCTALRCAAVRSQVKQAGAQQGCPAKHSPGVLPASAAAVAAALLTTSAWLGNAVQPAVAAVYVDQLPSSGAATSTMVARERPDRATALRAPTLTAHGDDMRESVHDIVESGITDIVGSSMSAVGGPVTADMLLEPHSHQHAALDEQQPVAGPTKQLQPAAAQAQPQHQPWCGMWAAYCNALEASPLCTKTCIGIAGTLLGDTAAQLLAHARTANRQRTRFVFDAPRAARLCLYSAAIGTPMGHFWYALLDSAVPGDPTSAAVVIAKLAADQLLQTPLGMALYFAFMKVLEGGNQHDVQAELQNKMGPALVANYKLWPAAQLINFGLIPSEQRILFGNIVGIAWTCIISSLQASEGAAPDVGSHRLGPPASLTGLPPRKREVSRPGTPIAV